MAKTHLITGTNRGIGLELTRQLLDRGEHVIATARKPESSQALQDLASVHSGTCTVEALDITSNDSVGQLASKLNGQPIDVLLNNAAILYEFEAPFTSVSMEHISEMYEVNVVGTARVTDALMPSLQLAERPVVVNISSGAGSIGTNEYGKGYGYRMTKAALNMFTKCLSIEYPNMIVLSMDPGWVQTDMGGSGADYPVDESVRNILGVLEGIGPQNSGTFMNLKGETVPW